MYSRCAREPGDPTRDDEASLTTTYVGRADYIKYHKALGSDVLSCCRKTEFRRHFRPIQSCPAHPGW